MIELNARVRAIPSYPAAETYEYGGELAKLASNETPWPPHPTVLEAIQGALGTLNRYPDPDKSLLRRRIADRHEVPVPSAMTAAVADFAASMFSPGAVIVGR